MSTMKPTVPLTIGESKGSSLLRDALRNNTRYEQSSERKEDGVEALKIEAQKFLKQCGGTLNQSTNNSDNRYGSGTGSDRNYSNKQNNNKGYGSNVNEDRFGNRNNNNNNGHSGSSWENSNNDGDWNINSFWNGSKEQNSRRGNGQNPNNAYGNEENYYGPSNNNNPSSSFGLNNQPDRRNYDMWTPPRRYQPSGSNNDFNVKTRYDGNLRFNNRPSSEECGDQGHNGNVPRSPFGNSNLPRRLRSSYFNREDDDDNDNDCISQCVLGYMQLLDADRSPSETLIIKWLQEHVTRNEMDRIKALRETRKCFGKLVTTDIEDGCEYAKELSKCLELDLE